MAKLVYKNFKKCGEITTLLKLDKKIYALNCIFCEEICLEFANFIQHIEEAHYDALENTQTTTTTNTNETETKASNEAVEKLTPNAGEDEEDDQNVDCIQTATTTKTTIVTSKNYTEIELSVKAATAKTVDDDDNDADNADDDDVDDDDDDYRDPLGVEIDINNKVEEDLLEMSVELNEIDDNASEEYLDEDEFINFDTDYDNNETYKNATSDSESCNDNSEQFDDNSKEPDVAEKKLTLAIICGYKAHSILWNNSARNARNHKKRANALMSIARAVNQELDLNLNWKNICHRIKSMRYKFRKELINQKLLEQKGEIYKPLWYFDKLSFLNESIKYKPRRKRGTKALKSEKPALPIPNLNDAQNIEFIAIYKSYPCLWDAHNIEFRFKNQRQDALMEMLENVKNKMNLNLTLDDLQKKLYLIRYACTSEKHRQLKCERSQEKFMPICKYYDQISFLMDNVGPFKCEYCKKIFNGCDAYKVHKSKHDNTMPFSCPLCKRGFMKAGNCLVHLRRHTRDYLFECKECGKRYATTTDINVHMRYHTGEKPYICDICGQSFRTWTVFDTHMRRHEKRPHHKCTICARSFYENNKLREHMKAHLNVRDKVCTICGKGFTSSKYLRQHKQIHAEKKKYSCKICGKEFAQHAGLSGHMKSHGTSLRGTIETKVLV